MSGAQYHISYSQIRESERRIKLSSMLRIFSHQQESDYVNVKDLIQSFSPPPDEPLDSSLNLDLFLTVIRNIPTLALDTSILQSIAFVGGYAVHSYMKQSKSCEACFSMLTQDKELDLLNLMTHTKLQTHPTY